MFFRGLQLSQTATLRPQPQNSTGCGPEPSPVESVLEEHAGDRHHGKAAVSQLGVQFPGRHRRAGTGHGLGRV